MAQIYENPEIFLNRQRSKIGYYGSKDKKSKIGYEVMIL